MVFNNLYLNCAFCCNPYLLRTTLVPTVTNVWPCSSSLRQQVRTRVWDCTTCAATSTVTTAGLRVPSLRGINWNQDSKESFCSTFYPVNFCLFVQYILSFFRDIDFQTCINIFLLQAAHIMMLVLLFGHNSCRSFFRPNVTISGTIL